MRYFASKYEQYSHDQIYRIYMSEMLRAITGSNVRYSDLIETKQPADTRTSSEIIANMKSKLKKIGEEE